MRVGLARMNGGGKGEKRKRSSRIEKENAEEGHVQRRPPTGCLDKVSYIHGQRTCVASPVCSLSLSPDFLPYYYTILVDILYITCYIYLIINQSTPTICLFILLILLSTLHIGYGIHAK